MLRILKSLMVIVAVAAVSVGATGAYFSDQETSTGNSFTAGSLDLTVDGQNNPTVVHVTKTDMKPQLPYTFQGYNNQWVIKNIQNFENSCIEPESGLLDTTCGAGSDQGELGQYTWVKWSKNGGTTAGAFSSPQFNPLNTAADAKVTGPVLQPGETLNAYMWLDFPTRADGMENLTQGDSMTFDVQFDLNQV